jgi:hypothetical protein
MGNFDPTLLGGIGGGCCCLLVLLIGIIIAVKMMGKKKDAAPEAQLTDSRPAAPTAGKAAASAGERAVNRVAQFGNIISSVTDDGFYISNQYLVAGSIIHYRYRSPLGWINRSVAYQPGGPQGQFVPVGATPSDLQVIDVVQSAAAAGTAVAADPMRTMMIESPLSPRTPPSPPPASKPSSYPSAY